ncbi:hypothetical protein CYPRO_2439 [Cyclonatronum proteinivorum]|uniref:Uncharacterized protein n=1 Tax=Cyclonatronum proteinivorum TaxID=1457365 RepID=A0A345UMH9_9BACT|nr:hypothetical protein [Cyclonatronum proteinivorum]AXJ01681.1 hypothetical protein CYPRO_2439 [Cyclonatronum proteinivorum]
MLKTKFHVHIEPQIKTKEKLSDIINRINWWLPFDNIDITIHVAENLLNSDINHLETPTGQFRYIGKSNCHIHLQDATVNTIPDYLLCHVNDEVKYYEAVFPNTPVLTIDKFKPFFKGEASSWGRVSYETQKYRISEYDSISKRNIIKFENSIRDIDVSYCFTSGPSLDRYRKHYFKKKSLKIICNGVIYNKELLEYLGNIDLLCVLDVYYFFSSSIYTAKFFETVIEYLKNKSMYIVMPWYKLPLVLSHYPKLENNIIGISTSHTELNFPSLKTPFVKKEKYPNVLRTFMLPIASAYTNEIYILGADGYSSNDSRDENWKYSVQIKNDEARNSVKEVNPALTKERESHSIYLEHCKQLDELLQFGRKKGNRYYSMEKSNIECLNNIYIDK